MKAQAIAYSWQVSSPCVRQKRMRKSLACHSSAFDFTCALLCRGCNINYHAVYMIYHRSCSLGRVHARSLISPTGKLFGTYGITANLWQAHSRRVTRHKLQFSTLFCRAQVVSPCLTTFVIWLRPTNTCHGYCRVLCCRSWVATMIAVPYKNGSLTADGGSYRRRQARQAL